MQTLEGLYYAHTKKDDRGVSLNVVHRDISPPNIIMTTEGHVKITDFGLAKATTQLEKTSPNSLKGKIDYMSPEQAKGETVDQRTDIFATAILLYELLSNKKLYSNKATRETLDTVQKADIQPIRNLNPNVQVELESILKKALEPNPEDRYQTALEFQNDLAIYIFKNNLKVITHDISESLIQAFTYKKEVDKVKQNKEDMIDQLIMNALFRVKTIQEGDNVKDIISNTIAIIDSDKPLNIFSEEDELKQTASLQFENTIKKSSSNKKLIISIIIIAIISIILATIFYLK
jgi:serine/threonine-protein kinase